MTRLAAVMHHAEMNAANRFQRTEQKLLEQRRTDAWRAHRAGIEDGVDVPVIRVPNRRVQIRFTGRCPFCRGTAFDLHWPTVDLEHPHVAYRGAVHCLLCTREVAKLVIGEPG